jgi:hypothetical protein
MRIFLKSLTATLALIFLTVLAPSGRAGDEPGFVVVQADAYAHYREAAFYARTGNAAVAGLALDEFIVKWTALVEAYADSPPADYAGDADWKNTLHDVLTRAETGLDALDADDPDAAKDAIGPIRGILGDLRRRNNVITYSDHVNALSAAMNLLSRYRKEVKDLGDAKAVAMVREQAAIVEALFEKCRDQAAREVATDPEFKRLVDGAAESMGKLLKSLETGDILLYRIGIGELRSYERIMFLRFG